MAQIRESGSLSGCRRMALPLPWLARGFILTSKLKTFSERLESSMGWQENDG
jgi:hypothetical protein